MKTKTLQKKIALLEFENDQLRTEVEYVDRLLKLIGFADGLETIKLAAQEILSQAEDGSEQLPGDVDHKNEQSL
jgi:hypothetical protein